MASDVSPPRTSVVLDRRACWVCFATDDDDPFSKWVKPCRCKGTTKWVHTSCLQRWFDEKQNGNPTVQVFCPQCNTEYMIHYPPFGVALICIDKGWKLVDKVCPLLTGSFLVGSLYWTAVTFGAVSVMQIMGHKHGLEIMEEADPLFLLVGLPTIPFALLLGEMIRWEDRLLAAWRKQSQKWWIIRKLFGSIAEEHMHYSVFREPAEPNNGSMNVARTTRVLCSALMMPTFATACGNYLFGRINSPVKRTVFGGIVFLLFRGLLKMYYKQQQYVRLASREIANFYEEEDMP